MPLCRPAPLHDVHPWKVLEQTDALALEQSDCPALLEEAFRVVLGEARAVIATAGDKENIAADWNLCKRYADLVRRPCRCGSGERDPRPWLTATTDAQCRSAPSVRRTLGGIRQRAREQYVAPAAPALLPLSSLV